MNVDRKKCARKNYILEWMEYHLEHVCVCVQINFQGNKFNILSVCGLDWNQYLCQCRTKSAV
jgi:hypothetical protein